MSMILQCKDSAKPHPEGIHAALCVDVIDLGLVEVEFQGQRKMVNKVKVVFETEAKWEDGRTCTVSKNFTASLHPKAKLADFLGKWRGRTVVPGETIDLSKLVGACCTLVISHQQNLVGKTYASIDAISKPTRKLVPSGQYDPAEMRRRIAESVARATASPNPAPRVQQPQDATGAPGADTSSGLRPPSPQGGDGGRPSGPSLPPKSGPAQAPEYDPEVGF